jgi:carboxypeptidase family protein
MDVLRRKPRPDSIHLGNLQIASPCPADWNKMVGDERVRHCSECNLNVYNLSTMTERQVQELIASSRGSRLCARLYRRADGTVLTQDCPWSFRVLTRKISRLAAAVLAAIMGVTVAMARNKPRPATCECSQSQQKDSGIKLIVMDQQGAVIPKAGITVKGRSIKELIAGVTGPSGEWIQPKLTAGRYKVTVKAQGFSTFSSVVEVRDEALLALKVKLPVAAVNTTVNVAAEAVVVQGLIVDTTTQNPYAFPTSKPGGQRSPMQQ